MSVLFSERFPHCRGRDELTRAAFPFRKLCASVLTTSSWLILLRCCFPSSLKGYGLPVVCTDCSGSTDSMNVHIYPKESEYYSESLKTVENTYPNALSSKERSRKRGAGTSLLHPQPCNGIASGKRVETDGSLYPSNHDRIRPVSTTSPLLADKHGTCFPGDVFLRPAVIKYQPGYIRENRALFSPISFFNWLKGVSDAGRLRVS